VTQQALEKGRQIDSKIRNFRNHRPGDYFKVFTLLVGARITGIVEVWVILRLLGLHVGPLEAAGIFTAGQLFYYLTLFLPTRIGVLEGGAVGIFKLFSLPGPMGLAMEVIRRLRKLAYNVLGLALLGWLGVYKRRQA
jgi:hypothetical protein